MWNRTTPLHVFVIAFKTDYGYNVTGAETLNITGAAQWNVRGNG
jgi:hypothetical protein